MKIKMLTRLLLYVLITVLLFYVSPSLGCGISTHIEVGERASEYLGIVSDGVDYRQLIRKHSDAFQAGASYPDSFYPTICYGGQYSNIAEDTHWTPFMNATVNYIRRQYPKPWNDTVEKLVVFLLSVVQHQVADQTWHSLGIDQGFLETMGDINCLGSFSEAHSLGDTGGDVMNVFGLNMDYVGLVRQWYVPVDDLVVIYEELYGQKDVIPAEVIRNCSSLLFMGRLGENIGAIEVTYPFYASNSPFLVDRLQDYFLGGMDDMAVWTQNVWYDTVNMIDYGTDVCTLPKEPIYIECNPPSQLWQVHENLSKNKEIKQKRTAQKRFELDSLFANVQLEEDIVIEQVGNGILMSAPRPHVNEEVLNEKFVAENFQSPSFSYDTSYPYSRLGETMVTGDINNDGFIDLVVGAPGFGSSANYQQGRVYIVYGSANGFPRTNASIETVADVIIDGPRLNGRFGTSVALLDFNIDGLLDIAVGAPHAGSENLQYHGAIYVYFGRGASGPSPTANIIMTCTQKYSTCGWSLLSIDINKDALLDLVIGIPTTAGFGGEQRGSVIVLLADVGRVDGARYDELWSDWSYTPSQNFDWFGFSMTSIVTTTNDVYLAVGAPSHRVCFRTDCAYDTSDIQAAGQVFIFKMPARSLPDAILTGVEEFQQFGASLSSGVFGSTEVLAITSLTRSGTEGNQTQVGEISLYDVSTLLNPGVQPIKQIYGDSQFARFGARVSFFDANADGNSDMLVSSPLWSASYRAGAESGQLNLFDGSEVFESSPVNAMEAQQLAAIAGEEKSRFGTSFVVVQNNQKTVVVGAPHTNVKNGLTSWLRLSGSIHFFDNIAL